MKNIVLALGSFGATVAIGSVLFVVVSSLNNTRKLVTQAHEQVEKEDREAKEAKQANITKEANKKAALKKQLEETKEQRDKLVEDLQKKGLFIDLHLSNHVGRVRVSRTWNQLDFDTKTDFAKVAYMWCLDADFDTHIVMFHDSLTNKKIGRYSELLGMEVY